MLLANPPPLFPFLSIPYSLPLSTPATQAKRSSLGFSMNDLKNNMQCFPDRCSSQLLEASSSSGVKKEVRSEIKTIKQVSGSGKHDHESMSTLGDLHYFSQ